MAQIIEETITVKFSRIVKSDAEVTSTIVTDEVISAIEMMAESMCGEHGIVEVTKNA